MIEMVAATKIWVARNYTCIQYLNANMPDQPFTIWPRSDAKWCEVSLFDPVIDFDGTVIDLREGHIVAFVKLAMRRKLGKTNKSQRRIIREEVIAAVDLGVNEPDTWRAIVSNCYKRGISLDPNPENPDCEVLRERSTILNEYLASGKMDVVLNPKLAPFLLGMDGSTDKELPFSIATGSPRAAVELALGLLKKKGQHVLITPDLLVCANETAAGKPAADPVEAAARKLENKTENRILVIGDTMSDVGAAVRAKARVCILGWSGSILPLQEKFMQLKRELIDEVGEKEANRRKTTILVLDGWSGLRRGLPNLS